MWHRECPRHPTLTRTHHPARLRRQAQELTELQALVQGEQPYGKAVLRLTAERKEAQEQLAPLERKAQLLEAELDRLQTESQRLRARNAQLLERERRRRSGGEAPPPGPKPAESRVGFL